MRKKQLETKQDFQRLVDAYDRNQHLQQFCEPRYQLTAEDRQLLQSWRQHCAEQGKQFVAPKLQWEEQVQTFREQNMDSAQATRRYCKEEFTDASIAALKAMDDKCKKREQKYRRRLQSFPDNAAVAEARRAFNPETDCVSRTDYNRFERAQRSAVAQQLVNAHMTLNLYEQYLKLKYIDKDDAKADSLWERNNLEDAVDDTGVIATDDYEVPSCQDGQALVPIEKQLKVDIGKGAVQTFSYFSYLPECISPAAYNVIRNALRMSGLIGRVFASEAEAAAAARQVFDGVEELSAAEKRKLANRLAKDPDWNKRLELVQRTAEAVIPEVATDITIRIADKTEPQLREVSKAVLQSVYNYNPDDKLSAYRALFTQLNAAWKREDVLRLNLQAQPADSGFQMTELPRDPKERWDFLKNTVAARLESVGYLAIQPEELLQTPAALKAALAEVKAELDRARKQKAMPETEAVQSLQGEVSACQQKLSDCNKQLSACQKNQELLKQLKEEGAKLIKATGCPIPLPLQQPVQSWGDDAIVAIAQVVECELAKQGGVITGTQEGVERQMVQDTVQAILHCNAQGQILDSATGRCVGVVPKQEGRPVVVTPPSVPTAMVPAMQVPPYIERQLSELSKAKYIAIMSQALQNKLTSLQDLRLIKVLRTFPDLTRRLLIPANKKVSTDRVLHKRGKMLYVERRYPTSRRVVTILKDNYNPRTDVMLV